MPHDRVRHSPGTDVYTLSNDHIFIETNKVLCDYHNIEADLLTPEAMAMFYPEMSPLRLSSPMYKYSFFYTDMPSSLTYLAESLVNSYSHSNLEWTIFMERFPETIGIGGYIASIRGAQMGMTGP